MIYDCVENLFCYAGNTKSLSKILEFLKNNDLDVLENGRYEIGEGVYCNLGIIEIQDSGRYEAHRKYADLQLVLSGSEQIKCAYIHDVYESYGYSETSDIEFFTGAKQSVVLNLRPGFFVLLYPQDAHMPCLRYNDEFSRKIVFKIPMPIK